MRGEIVNSLCLSTLTHESLSCSRIAIFERATSFTLLDGDNGKFKITYKDFI